jgi:CrcB protein
VADEDPDLPGDAARPLAPRLIAAVAVGGAVGALARYGLGDAFPTTTGSFPATTLAINVTGAFLLALLVGVIAQRSGPDPVWRSLLGTGLLGGYTTFSTFAVDSDRLTSTGHAGLAVGYVAATLVGGALATALGMTLAGPVAVTVTG